MVYPITNHLLIQTFPNSSAEEKKAYFYTVGAIAALLGFLFILYCLYECYSKCKKTLFGPRVRETAPPGATQAATSSAASSCRQRQLATQTEPSALKFIITHEEPIPNSEPPEGVGFIRRIIRFLFEEFFLPNRIKNLKLKDYGATGVTVVGRLEEPLPENDDCDWASIRNSPTWAWCRPPYLNTERYKKGEAERTFRTEKKGTSDSPDTSIWSKFRYLSTPPIGQPRTETAWAVPAAIDTTTGGIVEAGAESHLKPFDQPRTKTAWALPAAIDATTSRIVGVGAESPMSVSPVEAARYKRIDTPHTSKWGLLETQSDVIGTRREDASVEPSISEMRGATEEFETELKFVVDLIKIESKDSAPMEDSASIEETASQNVGGARPKVVSQVAKKKKSKRKRKIKKSLN